MIENILVLDTETSGLHPQHGAVCIEVAAILFNVEHRTILQSFSTLLPCKENPVEDINGIKVAATQATIPLSLMRGQLELMVRSSQAIIAHNAEFDIKFIKTLCIPAFDSVPWICTRLNFEWPKPLARRKLLDVCEAMGVPYERAHRAMSDCVFIVDCFNKVDDLRERLEKSLMSIGASNRF